MLVLNVNEILNGRYFSGTLRNIFKVFIKLSLLLQVKVTNCNSVGEKKAEVASQR